MSTICPQRVIAEAIRLLDKLTPLNESEQEEIANNVLELEALAKALPHRMSLKERI